MRIRLLFSLCAALSCSIGVATAAAKPRPVSPSQQLCESDGGTYSTKASASFFRPFYKKQGVVWSCNSYLSGSTTTQALVQACSSDGGQAWTAQDGPPGLFTCWKNPAV
jgi:hypothetical protein